MVVHRKKLAGILGIAAAIIASIVVLTWYLSFNTIEVHARPHYFVWKIVSHALRQSGMPAAVGLNQKDFFELPLLKLGSWCLRAFGGTYQAMMTYQYFFLTLLLASCGAFAWRLGGPYAGACAAWLAFFAPTSLGLATNADDQLILQALTAAGLALVVWTDQPRTRWLALLAALPVVLAVELMVYITNALIMWGTFACGAFAILVWQWVKWTGSAWSDDHKRVWPHPWFSTVGVLLALAAGLLVLWPQFSQFGYGDYYSGELSKSTYVSLGKDPLVVLAYPTTWFRMLVGPALAMACLLSFIVAWRAKKLGEALVAGGWLFLPMIFLTLISKRQDFYLFYAVPGSFALAALGLAALPEKWIRPGITVLLAAFMINYWVALLTIQNFKYPNTIRGLTLFSTPYLAPPDKNRENREEQRLADWVDQECGRRGLHTLLMMYVEKGIDPWALWLWHRNPNLAPADLASSDLLPGDRRCIIAYLPIPKPAVSLAEALGVFETYVKERRNSHFSLSYPTVMLKIAALQKIADAYRYAGSRNGFSLFIPEQRSAN